MDKMRLLFMALLAITLSSGSALADDAAVQELALASQEAAVQPPQETTQPQEQAPAPQPQQSTPAVQAAAVEQTTQSKCLSSIEFLTGFAWGKLRVAKRNYNAIPFMLDLDLDLKPLLEKIHIAPRPLVQFVIEPFASFITSPSSDAEIGNSFLVKIGCLPESSKFQPYFVGGAGMLYISLHTHEQGTQFNFIEYAGLGAHYYFAKDTALTLEGRFRHLSNAGIGSPNTGINSYFIVSGITKRF